MPDPRTVRLRKARVADAAAILEMLSSIIAEGRYLSSDIPPEREHFASFVRANLHVGAPFLVADMPTLGRMPARGMSVDVPTLVGWCDVLPSMQPGRQHSGRIGMGVMRAWRGQGIGRKLLENVLEACWQAGYLRLELEVFTDNLPAIRLYQSLGFVVEGEHQRVRRTPTGFQNSYSMALLRPAAPSQTEWGPR